MFIKIILTLIATAASRAIPQETVSRSRSRPTQIYSRTGHHMDISQSGSVIPSRSRPGLLSLLELVPISDKPGNFIIHGIVTGLYVKVKPGNRKVHGVFDQSDATIFTLEEILDNFQSFKLSKRPNCRLMVSRNQYRVRCSPVKKSKKISFLSKRSHFPKFSPFARHF